MKANRIFNQFLKEEQGIATIAKMVVKNMGGVSADNLRELYHTQNAANDCVSGFIWYTDTTKFWSKVRRYAMPYMEEMAWSLGESCVLAMVKQFNCLKDNYTESEIAISLYGNLRNSDQCVDNALAWFCLEESAYRFHEWCYEKEIDLDEVED